MCCIDGCFLGGFNAGIQYVAQDLRSQMTHPDQCNPQIVSYVCTRRSFASTKELLICRQVNDVDFRDACYNEQLRTGIERTFVLLFVTFRILPLKWFVVCVCVFKSFSQISVLMAMKAENLLAVLYTCQTTLNEAAFSCGRIQCLAGLCSAQCQNPHFAISQQNVFLS